MPPRHILMGYFEIAIAGRILSFSVSLSCGFYRRGINPGYAYRAIRDAAVPTATPPPNKQCAMEPAPCRSCHSQITSLGKFEG
jgi:hypothetical protein